MEQVTNGLSLQGVGSMAKLFRRFEYDWDKIRVALEQEVREKGITGQMLAEEIGMTQSLYSMFMNKKRTLGRESLHKICQYFGVPHEHWLKEVPIDEDTELLEKFEALLIAENVEKLPPDKQGILNLIKEQIKILYKEI